MEAGACDGFGCRKKVVTRVIVGELQTSGARRLSWRLRERWKESGALGWRDVGSGFLFVVAHCGDGNAGGGRGGKGSGDHEL